MWVAGVGTRGMDARDGHGGGRSMVASPHVGRDRPRNPSCPAVTGSPIRPARSERGFCSGKEETAVGRPTSSNRLYVPSRRNVRALVSTVRPRNTPRSHSRTSRSRDSISRVQSSGCESPRFEGDRGYHLDAGVCYAFLCVPPSHGPGAVAPAGRDRHPCPLGSSRRVHIDERRVPTG